MGYYAIPLKEFFSFFLSLSAIPRELIQHSDFQWLIRQFEECMMVLLRRDS